MLPFFPKQIATKALWLYIGVLAIVSIFFLQYAMSLDFIVMGLAWTICFFLLSSRCSMDWRVIPQKRFLGTLFGIAFLIRLIWVIFSYFYYQARTGVPFEFSAGDSMWYYEESLSYRNASLATIWQTLFVKAPTVSDSGFVFFLSLLCKVTGDSILLPRIVNAAFGAFTCVLVYRLACRSNGEQVGRLSAIFACYMPNLIYYCGLHLKETLMLLLAVAFLERTDLLLRSRKYSVWTILVPAVLLLSLFTFRTVLGISAAFAFVTALVFMNTSVVGRKKRLILIAWGALALLTFSGGVIRSEMEELWEDRETNQVAKRSYQTAKGNQWAKYATGTVMAPIMFVLPFPTMVDVEEQYNQQMLSGGNYVRNFLGGFVLIAVFSALFVKKDWRNLTLIGSFVIAYLGIISVSGFANSERFLLPGLPVLLILSAYGITLLDARNYRFIKIWYVIVPVAIIGWAIFKLGSRGLL